MLLRLSTALLAVRAGVEQEGLEELKRWEGELSEDVNCLASCLPSSVLCLTPFSPGCSSRQRSPRARRPARHLCSPPKVLLLPSTSMETEAISLLSHLPPASPERLTPPLTSCSPLRGRVLGTSSCVVHQLVPIAPPSPRTSLLRRQPTTRHIDLPTSRISPPHLPPRPQLSSSQNP